MDKAPGSQGSSRPQATAIFVFSARRWVPFRTHARFGARSEYHRPQRCLAPFSYFRGALPRWQSDCRRGSLFWTDSIWLVGRARWPGSCLCLGRCVFAYCIDTVPGSPPTARRAVSPFVARVHARLRDPISERSKFGSDGVASQSVLVCWTNAVAFLKKLAGDRTHFLPKKHSR